MVFKLKKIIKTKEGDVLRFLREKELKEFIKIYFSEILPKKIKAWKKNNSIEQNIIVPHGNIKLAIIKNFDIKRLKIISLGKSYNYGIYKIPKNTWYGFKCIGKEKALIINCISKTHNEKNNSKVNYDTFKIKW